MIRKVDGTTQIDGSGMYAYNSRFWMESANGGAFAIDPSFGLGLGQGNPFVVADDGTIVPKCIDPKTGELKLDKDGFPVGMNFWAGMDGQVYVRGHLVMESGEAHGDFYADNFYFNDGDSVRTLISKAGVDFSKMKKIDLGGIVLDGETGNINFTGVGSITWGNNAPVKYQFSTSMSGPWHDTMQTNDKYRRDSLDGGTTWGTAYQFRGTDGRNGADGSDANVPDWVQAYTKTATYIDNQWVIAPNIAGGVITALEKMEAACDFYVGNLIRLGKFRSGDTSIYFNDTANISSTGQDRLSISCEYLNLSQVSNIIWGSNVPKAVFA